MNRRSYLKTAGVTVTAGLFAGCSSSTDSGPTETESGSGGTTYGTLATSVTDQPSDIADFESLVVTIEGIWVKPAGGTETEETATEGTDTETGSTATETDSTETEMARGTDSMDAESADNDDGRRYVEFEEPQEADLVELQGANTQLIDETEVETGRYRSLQLDVAETRGTLTDGSDADVETPGNAPLRFNTSFEIREAERTTFVADFTPVRRGNGSYVVRPVASGTTVLYGDAEYTAEDASTATESGEVSTGDGGTETDSGTRTESDGPGNSGGNASS